MRAIFAVMLVALGVGLIGTSASPAAPTISGLRAIQSAVDGGSPIVTVRVRTCPIRHVKNSRRIASCPEK
jgi:hypothetical protein